MSPWATQSNSNSWLRLCKTLTATNLWREGWWRSPTAKTPMAEIHASCISCSIDPTGYIKSGIWLMGLVSTGVPMCPGCNLWGGGGCLRPTEPAVNPIYCRPHRHAHGPTTDLSALPRLSNTLRVYYKSYNWNNKRDDDNNHIQGWFVEEILSCMWKAKANAN